MDAPWSGGVTTYIPSRIMARRAEWNRAGLSKVMVLYSAHLLAAPQALMPRQQAVWRRTMKMILTVLAIVLASVTFQSSFAQTTGNGNGNGNGNISSYNGNGNGNGNTTSFNGNGDGNGVIGIGGLSNNNGNNNHFLSFQGKNTNANNTGNNH
jgi:hypothetical protein